MSDSRVCPGGGAGNYATKLRRPYMITYPPDDTRIKHLQPETCKTCQPRAAATPDADRAPASRRGLHHQHHQARTALPHSRGRGRTEVIATAGSGRADRPPIFGWRRARPPKVLPRSKRRALPYVSLTSQLCVTIYSPHIRIPQVAGLYTGKISTGKISTRTAN